MNHHRRFTDVTLSIVLLLFFAANGCVEKAQGMIVQPNLIPVNRLVRNAEHYLEKHPSDAYAHYKLGRVHHVAVEQQTTRIAGYPREEDSPPEASDYEARSTLYTALTNWPLSSKQILEHANSARKQYQEALRLAPKSGVYQLALAYLLQYVRDSLRENSPQEMPSSWKSVDSLQIRAAYIQAYIWSIPSDRKVTERGMDRTVSENAARAFIRLAEEEPNTLTPSEKRFLLTARRAQLHFQNLPLGAISPMVFSLVPNTRLQDKLRPEASVDFDLRGWGSTERWSWIDPSLGLLVWDPLQSGQITSGRQLFGSYTFNIINETGYKALELLDDDADGQLTGKELRGIRVWFDRDGNGRSEPDEVVSLKSVGVQAIATMATNKDGIHPTNSAGITLRDGTHAAQLGLDGHLQGVQRKAP